VNPASRRKCIYVAGGQDDLAFGRLGFLEGTTAADVAEVAEQSLLPACTA